MSLKMGNQKLFIKLGFYGVMVSTLDFESSDPSSNLGRTLFYRVLWKWRDEVKECRVCISDYQYRRFISIFVTRWEANAEKLTNIGQIQLSKEISLQSAILTLID